MKDDFLFLKSFDCQWHLIATDVLFQQGPLYKFVLQYGGMPGICLLLLNENILIVAAMPTNKKSSLTFLAGARAKNLLARDGLHPEMVKVVAGAAGGPKWLVLGHLDRFLFSQFFTGRTAPLYLLGSSIGAWRFACAAQKDPVHAIDIFQRAYVEQSYSRKPSAEEVSAKSREMLDAFLGPDGVRQALDHPYLRLSLLAVRSSPLLATDAPLALSAGVALSALFNLFSRKSLAMFYHRTLFSSHEDNARRFLDTSGLKLETVALSQENFKPAVLASGSIPLVMTGVPDIAGAPAGVYRDGGIIDYHLDFRYRVGDGIVLMPHFFHRIIPGWFDKNLPWRKRDGDCLQDLLLVAPSEDFVKSLPYGKIPDRGDFKTFQGRDKERMAYWNAVISASERLADDFQEVIENGLSPNEVKLL